MKAAWCAVLLARVILVAVVSLDAIAESDTCKEDGGTAYCIGPVVGPFRYQVSDGFTVGQGSDEARTIETFRQTFIADNKACTANLTDNLPAQPIAPIGFGHLQVGDYGTALGDGSAQFWSLDWMLSTVMQSVRIPLVLNATYPTDSSPPCKFSYGPKGVYVARMREVGCPPGPIYSWSWSATPNAYCYRQPVSREPVKNLGQCGGSCTDPTPKLGNPTNASTGNKLESETDYVGSGTFPLQFVRYYNSQLWQGTNPPSSSPGYWSRLGPSWRSTYDRFIRYGESTVVQTAFAYRSDGRTLYFKLSGGQFVPDEDIADRLVRLTDGSGNPIGWRYTAAATEEVEIYDVSGKLTSITSRAGVIQSLAYDSQDRLQSVTDSFGRALSFSYDTSGRLATLTDPDGKVFTYAYTTEGNVSSVTYPDTKVRTYVYNESANTSNANLPYAMTGIVDETNTRFATFKYDLYSRVLSSEHAGGTLKYSFTYVPNAYYNDYTIVTDPLLRERIYDFTTTLGVDRLVSVNQPCSQGCGSGAAAAISYDVNGNASSRTDFNGNVTNYSYDLARNLETSRTEAYGTPRARTISTTWHSTYRLPTQIDEAGKRTTFTHDANGNVLTKTETDTATSTSRTWTYTYNSYGQMLTADGPRTDVSDVTTYTYYNCTTGYECGQVHTITNGAGHVTTFNTYNAHGQPLTITDPNGLVTTLAYDLRQRLTSRTVGGEQTTFTYWPTGLLKKATLPDSSFLEYSYDAAHRLTSINDSEGNHITYTLDAMGNRTADQVYDPSNTLTQTRTRVFNTLSQLWKEIGAAGTTNVTTVFGYDNNGNQTTINAPLSRNTTQGYDELNRLTRVTDPLSGVTQYGYNALDQLISVTDPRSKITSYTYNALGDLTQQVSPDTGTTTNTYDSGGNLHTSTDARSKTATYAYDALNRVTSTTYPDQTISYTYDTGTNQKGRLTQVSDASGSTSWSFDSQGRVLSKQQSMGISKTIGYSYDSFGRLQTLTLPSGNTISYGYTNDKMTSLTLNGSTTILSNVLYEPFGPTRGWTWGNSTLAVREYDADGKITDIDSAGLKTYGYDNAFRITSISDATDSNLGATYGYDAADRLNNYIPGPVVPPVVITPSVSPSATSVPAGGSFSVTVSGVSERSDYWVALASTGVPESTYSKWSAVTQGSGNFVWNLAAPDFPGAYEVRLFAVGFDRRARSVPLTVAAVSPPAQPALAASVGTAVPGASVTVRLTSGPGGASDWFALAQVGAPNTSYLQWTYVGSGVTSRDWTVTMPATAGNYEFRLFLNNGYTLAATSPPVTLTSAPPVAAGLPDPGPSGPAGYTYDLNGNRLTGESSTYTISRTSNRVTGVSDALSRTFSYDDAGNTTSDGAVTFTYNDAGRMVSATKAGVTTTYALNALGQRVKKTTAGSSRYFVYDEAGHLVGEYDSSGSLIEETVWFGDMPVAILKPNGGSGVNVFYIHTDHLNTPRRISRPSDNAIVWRWDSDPFGTTAANQDPDGDTNLFAFNLRFPGQYFDIETGLHYNYMRDYDPAVGRYVESDPIGLQGGLNTYAYVGENPVSGIDPTGLCECKQSYLDCLANCIRQYDPLSDSSKFGLSALGGTFPKRWIGLGRGLGGASPLTTVPSAVAYGAGGGASGIGAAARGAGRLASPVWIGYGLYLFGMESWCAIKCAGDNCAF